jgi:hypothetical protein
MDQHQSSVDKVESIVGQRIRYDIVTAYGESGMAASAQISRIDIGGQH